MLQKQEHSLRQKGHHEAGLSMRQTKQIAGNEAHMQSHHRQVTALVRTEWKPITDSILTAAALSTAATSAFSQS